MIKPWSVSLVSARSEAQGRGLKGEEASQVERVGKLLLAGALHETRPNRDRTTFPRGLFV